MVLELVPNQIILCYNNRWLKYSAKSLEDVKDQDHLDLTLVEVGIVEDQQKTILEVAHLHHHNRQ